FVPSGSDFEETEAARKAHHIHQPAYRHLPDIEELDEESNAELEKDNGASKRKQKAMQGAVASYRAGPILNDVKEQALALQASFHQGIEALAAKIGK
ncbi:hypothetical protein H0H87_000208, partial [Tephrocybe sp. NHM501043]